jgi:hypothetical protein
MERRNFLKAAGVTALATVMGNRLIACNSAYSDMSETNEPDNGEKSKVFMTTDISPAGGLVQSPDGTIVECNTVYGRQRANTARHKQVAADHGFTAIAPVDISEAHRCGNALKPETVCTPSFMPNRSDLAAGSMNCSILTTHQV